CRNHPAGANHDGMLCARDQPARTCPTRGRPCNSLAMPFDVFISYSHKDQLAADATCAALEAEGVRCWIAPRNLRAGSSWARSIIEGIDHCGVMVLVFSSNANASEQVAREVERALHKGLIVIPLRIEPIEPGGDLEYFLARVHWLDSINPPEAEQLKRLAGDIKEILKLSLGHH